jgi:hypothetical protein
VTSRLEKVLAGKDQRSGCGADRARRDIHGVTAAGNSLDPMKGAL